MKLSAAPGWQTVLADLALILFVSSAAALAQGEAQPNEPSPVMLPDSASETPSALYSTAPGARPFTEWLTAQPRDPREKLTLVAIYAPAERAAVSGQLSALAAEAERAGFAAAIVLRPGERSRVAAQFAFDGES